MKPLQPRPAPEPGRAAVLDLIRARVAPRFALTAEAFAERVVALVSPGEGAAEARERASRLVLDDLYLAQACAGGDPEAWRELEGKHFAFIRDFARRFLDPAQAGDLAADVIAHLWQRGKIARFEGRSTLRTWLGAVVTHAALNVRASRRAAAAGPPEPENLDRPVPPDVDDGAGAALAGWVRSAIAGLAAEDKLLLLLHYEQGLSLDDMAPIAGASKATLSRRLARARQDVRRAVEEMAIAEGGPGAAASLGSAIAGAQAELDLAAILCVDAGVKGSAGTRV